MPATKYPGKVTSILPLLLLLLLSACSQSPEKSPTGTVTDIDGNRYGTVKIGSAVWMSENLRTTHYRNGDPVPEVQSPTAWGSTAAGAWCNYDNRAENGNRFGRLYNWQAVNDPRGLAPRGWHVATDREWSLLATALGGEAVAGASMKASGKWQGTGNDTAEASGFDALPAGARRDSDGAFVLLEEYSRFWSSTESGPMKAWGRAMGYFEKALHRGEVSKRTGFSVRCVQD
jgi:uncharacterized protein (TIGR02145 family)